MKLIILSSLIFLYSCGYPDLDSVPNFKKLKLSKDESIDLCNTYNSDKNKISECLKKVEESY